MRRREFIGITLSALALPPAVRPEKAIPLVGWLSGDDEAAQKAFNSGLSELGYDLGGNVRVEYCYANGKYDELQD
jgi:putative ABC transport system substrate-binding protein